MPIKSTLSGFPGYHGRWPLQNFICALFHDADLAIATRGGGQRDILHDYGIVDQERILVVPSAARHLNREDVSNIFEYCRARLDADRPWAGGVPAVDGSWRTRPVYGADMHWPVQNLFNLYVQEADIAGALVRGTDSEKIQLFEHFGVPGADRELFLGASDLTLNAMRVFARSLDEFSADAPKNIW